MPNWVTCELTVNGPEKALQALKEYVRSKECAFDFERILPTPPELMKAPSPAMDQACIDRLTAKYGATDWFNWRCNNWGCKWSPDVPVDTEWIDAESGLLVFETPWSPPRAIIKRLSSLPAFCELEFELSYCEPGMVFAGRYTCAGGNGHDDYTQDPDDLLYRELVVDLCGGDGDELIEEEKNHVE